MPELPEAEAARARIAGGALNRTITAVTLGEVSHMDMPSEAARQALVGTQLTTTHRHGKYIFVRGEEGPWLHIHLGMAGAIRVAAEAPKYTRLSVAFEDGPSLHFRDPRKFGHVQMVDDLEAFIAAKRLGPDALQIGGNAFADTIGRTRGAVKSALLNQRKLAGVGNLWADETLFRSKVHPATPGTALPAEVLTRMHRDMLDILNAVIATGANYAQLPRDWLIHNRTVGAQTAAGGRIEKMTTGGRTSFYCPAEQILPD